MTHKLISLLGLFVMLLLAWGLSENRRRMNLRLILSGLILQFFLAVLILWTTPGQWFFEAARIFVAKITAFADAGSAFVFGENFKEHVFAFSVLPMIIFVSSLMAILFHLGIMQKVVAGFAWVMVRLMDVSGAESLGTTAEVFMGLAEAPLVVRPYLQTMTRSELLAIMVAGMATISGATMAAYSALGADPGHLLTASIISAPASLVIAKIMLPETETSSTKGTIHVEIPKQDRNVLGAACRGALDGVQMAINVGAVLICFIAIVAMLNWFLSALPNIAGEPLSLERLLGWICRPLAWLMGVEGRDAEAVGMLIGKKTVLNEFVAYLDLVKLKETISPRSFTIATYALCGFANFGSVAIQLGGLGTLIPLRRDEIARLGLKAMVGGALATFTTACIAGILL